MSTEKSIKDCDYYCYYYSLKYTSF